MRYDYHALYIIQSMRYNYHVLCILQLYVIIIMYYVLYINVL